MAKRLSKKVAKLEQQADELRKRAEKRGHELQSRAAERIERLQPEPERRSRKGLVAFLLAAAAAVGFVAKRKRDQELDESLWEDPKSL
ncbi:MAG: hypothetical protein WD377_03975 [Nitriliruptoraceae bacterium]